MHEEEMMYIDKIFKESEIAYVEFSPENIALIWLDKKLYDTTTHNHNNGKCDGYYKITIERFDSEEEVKDDQERFV